VRMTSQTMNTKMISPLRPVKRVSAARIMVGCPLFVGTNDLPHGRMRHAGAPVALSGMPF
jgi:hypothetical protein